MTRKLGESAVEQAKCILDVMPEAPDTSRGCVRRPISAGWSVVVIKFYLAALKSFRYVPVNNSSIPHQIV